MGFKRSEDLGNGLSAIYQHEFGVDASGTASIAGTTNGDRLSFVGLKGGRGSLTIGRQWNDAFFVGTNGDFGINTYEDGFQHVRNYNSNSVGFWNRQDDMLKYTAPTIGGVTLAGNITTNGASGESSIEEYTLSARAVWGNFQDGVYWNQIRSEVVPGPSFTAKTEDNTQDTYGIDAKFFMQSLPLTFNAAYNRTDNGGNGTEEHGAANWHADVTVGLPGPSDLYVAYENYGESNRQNADIIIRFTFLISCGAEKDPRNFARVQYTKSPLSLERNKMRSMPERSSEQPPTPKENRPSLITCVKQEGRLFLLYSSSCSALFYDASPGYGRVPK